MRNIIEKNVEIGAIFVSLNTSILLLEGQNIGLYVLAITLLTQSFSIALDDCIKVKSAILWRKCVENGSYVN